MSRSMAVKYFFLLVFVVGLAVIALAQDSSGINFSFQGCRNDGSITLPNPNPPYAGQYICPDTAYTGGELGKGWNELDLVPYRLTTTAKKKATNPETYSVTIADWVFNQPRGPWVRHHFRTHAERFSFGRQLYCAFGGRANHWSIGDERPRRRPTDNLL